MKRCWSAMVGILFLSATAHAALYAIPLDGLEGIYETQESAPGLAPGHRQIDFDFQTRFESIDAVYLDLRGTIAPGRRFFSLAHETYEYFAPLRAQLGPSQQTPNSALVSVEEDGTFDRHDALALVPPASWDFLLNGRGFLRIDIGSELIVGNDWELIPSIAAITSASLVIEGVAVPEPAALLLLPPVALLFLLRRA